MHIALRCEMIHGSLLFNDLNQSHQRNANLSMMCRLFLLWKHRNIRFFLNGFDNTLYIMCIVHSRPQNNWETHWMKNTKQKIPEQIKFIILDYKMVDSKTIISQVQDLQWIMHEMHTEGMFLSGFSK